MLRAVRLRGTGVAVDVAVTCTAQKGRSTRAVLLYLKRRLGASGLGLSGSCRAFFTNYINQAFLPR